MRYAIFSDAHGNLRAWEEALADIRAQQVDVLICLGDAVGYGPKPEEVLGGIRAVTKNFIIGNHEAAAAGMMDYSIFNDNAKHSVEWTKQALSAESHEYLKTVPLAIEAGDILFVHAEITEPGRFEYIDDQEKARENFTNSKHFVTFVGHTHHPKIFQLDGRGRVSELPDQNRPLDPSCRYIVNVGSVGEPRNENDLRGVYVIYDSETREIDFRRVAFDIEAYRAELESTTLNIKPFFLQCYEYQTAEAQLAPPISDALTPAMEAPAVMTSPVTQDTGPVTLHIPSDNRAFQGTTSLSGNEKKDGSRLALPLTLISVIVLGLIAWGVMHFRSQEPDASLAQVEDTSQAIAEPKSIPQPPDPTTDPPESIPPPVKPEPGQPTTAPDTVAKRDPKPVAPPTKPKPDPKPVVVPEPKPDPTVAWWRMEPDSVGEKLIDSTNKSSLPVLASGKTIGMIAPSALPPHDITNTAAMSLGVWAEPSPSGKFALRADRSFTFEGWFLVARSDKAIFLAGTRSGDANDKQGWHIDIRSNGQMCFFYDNGPQIIQALSEKLPIADLKPHHFAAVWDHDASAGAGEMQLYIDGKQVATAKVPMAKIPPAQANPFSIGSPKNPPKVGLDEVRFTRGVLRISKRLRPMPSLLVENGLVLNLVGDALVKIAKSVKAPHRPKPIQLGGVDLLRFDGKDDFITIKDSSALDLKAWTVISVVRPLRGPGVVLAKNDDKSTLINYRLQVGADGKVGAVVRGPGHNQVHRVANVKLMKRYSVVAARYDPTAHGAKRITISVDGVPASSYSLELAKGPLGPTVHNAPLLIGLQPGKQPRAFKGDIGGILLYNRALGDGELQSTSKWLMEKVSAAKSAVANRTTKPAAKPSAVVGAKDAVVFLIAGEANASGIAAFSPQTNAQAKMQEKHPTNPKTTAAEVGIPTSANHFPRSHIWKPLKGPFEKLIPGQNLQAGWDPKRHGIELPMALLLQKKYPTNDIYFIKHGPAGASLHTKWRAGQGSEYKKFLRQYTPAMAHLKKHYQKVHVLGLYWDQGESDEKQARQYEGNLSKLIDALRKKTEQPDLPIYLREQGIFQHDKRDFRFIADAQARLAKKDENIHLLKLDLGSNEKNYKAWAWSIGNGHLSSKAYLELSRRIMATTGK